MVLQTSCRCLRQVQKKDNETALIWLNKFNADTLNKQLKQQQNITLQEFNNKKPQDTKLVERFSRMEQLKVPPIDFYQLKVSYETLIIDEDTNVSERLQDSALLCMAETTLIHQQDLAGNILGHYEEEREKGEQISFNRWLQSIVKESFNTCTISHLKEYTEELRSVFSQIVVEQEGKCFLNPKFNQAQIRSLIRQTFVPKRTFETREEVIPTKANLLRIENFTSPTEAIDNRFYPASDVVQEILKWDNTPESPTLPEEVLQKIAELSALGIDTSSLAPKKDSHPEREKSYHYLPYHFDSRFEIEYFADSILPIIKDKNLEVYFNGDDSLTEFKIDCYRQKGNSWQYIGKYVPDFLLMSRDANNEIHKVIIIETKGEGFATKFAERKSFMKTFVQRNNERFGYDRFDFLYLEDTISKEERERQTLQAINNFFND
jgi:hypothetical protein